MSPARAGRFFALACAAAVAVALPAPASGFAPPAPPACTAKAQTALNPTPLSLADNAVTSSTLVVSGAGPWLADVDVFTDIPHVWSADIDMTLTSPAGTIVTLTTDNGWEHDNVFGDGAGNGTLWDDDANPGGQLPYGTNPGLATDHPYANDVVPSPLVPEEALAAFIGEDPNGSWTLTVSDDSGGGTGTLDSWRLDLETTSGCPAPPPAPDTTAPKLTVTGKKRQRAGKPIKIKVTTDENAAVAAGGKVKAGKAGFKLRGVSDRAAAGEAVKLKLKPRRAKKLKKLVAEGQKATATIQVTATDASGNSSSAKLKVRLR